MVKIANYSLNKKEGDMLASPFLVIMLNECVGVDSIIQNAVCLTSLGYYLQLTPKLSLQITLHAFLLWASIGFLMPIGIIIIRMSYRFECGKKLKVLFYSHVIVQVSTITC